MEGTRGTGCTPRETTLPDVFTSETEEAVAPTRFKQYFPLLFSLFLHCGAMGGFLFLAGNIQEKAEQIYYISLEGFSLQGTSAGTSAGTSEGPSALPSLGLAATPSASSDESAPEQTLSMPESAPNRSTTAENKKTAPQKRESRPQKTLLAQTESRTPSKRPSSDNGETGQADAGRGGESPRGEGNSSSPSGSPGLGSGSGVCGAAQVDQKPSILRRITPEYPAKAKNMRVEGTVVVQIVIDASGHPAECSVYFADPPEYFEESALNAARKTRFLPGRIRGRPVKTLVKLPFVFRLK